MRLKIQALWIEAGDNNAKFFHRIAAHQRNQNNIWDIKNDEGIKVCSWGNIKKAVEIHFKYLFKDHGRAQIGN